MKLYVNHDTVVIESALTEEDLKQAAMFDPESAMLRKENNDTVFFAVAFNKSNPGTIATDAIVFNKVTAEKKMFVSFMDKKLPTEAGKLKSYIRDAYGTTLAKLQAVEDQITSCLLTREGTLDIIEASIVLDVE